MKRRGGVVGSISELRQQMFAGSTSDSFFLYFIYFFVLFFFLLVFIIFLLSMWESFYMPERVTVLIIVYKRTKELVCRGK